jgi:hypothetical protein
MPADPSLKAPQLLSVLPLVTCLDFFSWFLTCRARCYLRTHLKKNAMFRFQKHKAFKPCAFAFCTRRVHYLAVYGNDPVKWRQLVKTMCDLSGPHTLVIIGNVQRYPVHHPMAETKFFDEATAADFERREIPSTGLHPDFRRTGGGGCVVHVFRRRPESLKRRKEKDRQRGGHGGGEDDEEDGRPKGKKGKSKDESQKKSDKSKEEGFEN